jgi:hypothetical protein
MTILRRSQDEALSAVVVIDEEAYSPLKSAQTAAKTATAASKAFEIGAQIRIETFYRMGLLFGSRNHVGCGLRPDEVLVKREAVSTIA